MSDSIPNAAHRIAELEAELTRLRAAQPPPAPAGDAVGGDKVAGDKVGGDKQQGAVAASDTARIGLAIGLNLGTVIYGRPPSDDERRALVRYLDRLAAKLFRLPLNGLEERLELGDGLALPQVYVGLATTGEVEEKRGGSKELRRYYADGKLDQPLKPEYTPDHALPAVAITRVGEELGEPPRRARAPQRVLFRARLASEAVAHERRLVLCGDPGAGKSTFARHLAWALARRTLDPPRAPQLPGWSDEQRLLPILLPLRALAGRLERDGNTSASVRAALCAELGALGVAQPDALLDAALDAAFDRDAALLIFDGLDEVPLDRVPGASASRAATLRAVRDFVLQHGRVRALLTCRTRAFDKAAQDLLGWPLETLAPFTPGQIRAFVPAWYVELVAKGQITAELSPRLERALVEAATDPLRPRLREMTQTPLLLTLMALVLYTRRELPRDRPQLYARIVDLLLEQWDRLRDGETLADAIGLPDWTGERLLPLLARLSYDAHASASSQDGRGRLPRGEVYSALVDFFTRAETPNPEKQAGDCLSYLNRRSGLLVADNAQERVAVFLEKGFYMAEPIAIGATVIGALVALMAKYMEYRATVETAKKDAKPLPAEPAEAEKGKKALETVQAAIADQGNADERADPRELRAQPAAQPREPRNAALHELAARSQPFAQQLQSPRPAGQHSDRRRARHSHGQRRRQDRPGDRREHGQRHLQRPRRHLITP